MKILLIFLLIISFFCNLVLIKAVNHPRHENTELDKYKEQFFTEAFQRDCALKPANVTVRLGKLESLRISHENIVRRATTVRRKPYFLQTEIIVDVDWYRNATELQREKTLYHELAHIYLDRDHDNRHLYRNRQLIPISMMNRSNTEYYEQAKEYYLTELFR